MALCTVVLFHSCCSTPTRGNYDSNGNIRHRNPHLAGCYSVMTFSWQMTIRGRSSIMWHLLQPSPVQDSGFCRPFHFSISAAGLDIGLWQPLNQKIHWPPKKPTGPPKTCNDPNVFAAGIYDFTREVAHFCTLGLYITKNKYELTLPSEFCRFPVKIMAAYEALIFFFKPLAPRASGK